MSASAVPQRINPCKVNSGQKFISTHCGTRSNKPSFTTADFTVNPNRSHSPVIHRPDSRPNTTFFQQPPQSTPIDHNHDFSIQIPVEPRSTSHTTSHNRLPTFQQPPSNAPTDFTMQLATAAKGPKNRGEPRIDLTNLLSKPTLVWAQLLHWQAFSTTCSLTPSTQTSVGASIQRTDVALSCGACSAMAV